MRAVRDAGKPKPGILTWLRSKWYLPVAAGACAAVLAIFATHSTTAPSPKTVTVATAADPLEGIAVAAAATPGDRAVARFAPRFGRQLDMARRRSVLTLLTALARLVWRQRRWRRRRHQPKGRRRGKCRSAFLISTAPKARRCGSVRCVNCRSSPPEARRTVARAVDGDEPAAGKAPDVARHGRAALENGP